MTRQRLAALTASVLLIGSTGLVAAPPALAWWSDTGSVMSGPLTSWGITDVRCPPPEWGRQHHLNWAAPTGSHYTVTMTTNIEPQGLSYWEQHSPKPSAPWTGTDSGETTSSVSWGIHTNNAFESTDFHGTWKLVATPPDPAGGWTAIRTGTWKIHFSNKTIDCTVDPTH